TLSFLRKTSKNVSNPLSIRNRAFELVFKDFFYSPHPTISCGNCYYYIFYSYFYILYILFLYRKEEEERKRKNKQKEVLHTKQKGQLIK
ncbi:MAG TPA: hypothetical protein VJI97_01190, partial [Candidatus Nanoarchaeia archaeon]|nr:hypothetical protein [Candidatus Nanoarchaeia archaeon]